MSNLLLHVQLLGIAEREDLGFRCTDRAQRRRLGHAPGMQHLHAVIVLEFLDHRARTGRSADHDTVEIGQFQTLVAQMTEQRQPYCRHGRRDRHLARIQHLVTACGIEHPPRHDTGRTDQRHGKPGRPAIRMEQRHDRHHGVGGRQAQHVFLHHDHGVQHVRAVRIDHALGIAGGPGREAHPAGIVLRPVDPREGTVLGIKEFLVAKRVRQ